MISSTIKIPIYYGKIIVIFHDNFEEVVNKYNIDYDVPKKCYGLSLRKVYNNSTTFFIVLKESTTYSTIAHEVLHTTHRILSEIGQEACFDNDEAECYLHSWITEEVYRAANKHKIIVYI